MLLKKYEKLIYTVTLFIIFYILTIFVKNYFKPFFVILILFFFCYPLYNVLYFDALHNKRFSAILAILLVNIILFLVLIVLGNNIISNYELLMSTVYEDIKKYIIFILNRFNQTFGIDVLENAFKVGNLSFFTSELLKKGAIYTSEGMIAYFIANISIYFLLIDKNIIIDFIEKLIARENFNFIRQKYKNISSLIKIELLLVIITTIETIIGFLILRVENPVLLGTISGVLDLLPYVGTILIFFPLILYSICSKKYFVSVGLLLLYILILISRQIMETKFVSNKLKIHPLSILISLYIGMELFGVIGLFVGPIFVITVKEIIFQ